MINHYAGDRRPPSRIGVRRLSATGSIVCTILFIGSWLATQVPGSIAFMYVRIFTYSAPASFHALFEGLVWSSLLGFAVGFITAIAYNAIGALDQVPDLLVGEDVPSQGSLDAAWRTDKHIGVAEALAIVEHREKRRISSMAHQESVSEKRRTNIGQDTGFSSAPKPQSSSRAGVISTPPGDTVSTSE